MSEVHGNKQQTTMPILKVCNMGYAKWYSILLHTIHMEGDIKVTIY
jgi:hypothetical protein